MRLNPTYSLSAGVLASIILGVSAHGSLARQLPASHVSSERGEISQQTPTETLHIRIVDETGVAVAGARLTLVHSETRTSFKDESDYAGRSEFVELGRGAYELRVEKEGFYAVTLNDVQVGKQLNLEVTLTHQQEFAETINVIDSPKTIDPEKTAVSEGLGYREIINLPYPSTRDFRNALPLIPGVLRDATGQIHVAGSSTYQTFDQLDGFNITDPVDGLLKLRVSTDALRRLDVQSSGYSAEYGKGSGGVLSVSTGMGDDRYRFSATNFIPSVQNRKGIHINDWTPRATVSGPLRKKSAWFFEAADGDYKLNIVEQLPSGSDRNPVWRVGNLAKAQVNLSQTNVLTASFLINRSEAAHARLSRFNPLETTVDQRQSAYLFTLKDQAYLSNGSVLEVGLGASQFRADQEPMGNTAYTITPEGTRGNFFETARARARRLQAVASYTFPTFHWRGRHDFKLGGDIDSITYDQLFARRNVSILREDGTLARRIAFVDSPRFEKNNSEASGFAVDRWSPSDRLLLETGVRLDWDQIIRRASLSPRVAFTYLLTRDGNTKIAARAGLFHDATNLDFVARSLAGRRVDYFYRPDGQTLEEPPVGTSFRVDQQNLKVPRYLNWGVGLERKLPSSIYLSIDFLQKRGRDGFAFVNSSVNQSGMLLDLENVRRDRYDSAQIIVRRTFKEGYSLLASYTRSSARSNAVVDFNLDNPIFAQQAGGPLEWDAPNRFLSWGWLPLVKGFDVAYSIDWRDGYPFSVVNEEQQLVGAAGSRRFPDYFSLDVHVEKRLRIFGAQWAFRAGSNDVTNRHNPTAVNNNLDSPQFLTFGGQQHRVFTARIRFLGRK